MSYSRRQRSRQFSWKWFLASLAQTGALAKLLIEKGIVTQQEFLAKIAAEQATYQRILNPTPQ